MLTGMLRHLAVAVADLLGRALFRLGLFRATTGGLVVTAHRLTSSSSFGLGRFWDKPFTQLLADQGLVGRQALRVQVIVDAVAPSLGLD